MSRLSHKLAFVTGAASGIGAKTAELFAEHGATVVLTDINETAGELVAERIRSDGGRAHFYPLDVCDEDSWSAVIDTVTSELGALDILVNSAGIECIGMIDDLSMERWHNISRINIDGVFLGTKFAMRAMSGGGSIINISSVAGLIGTAGASAYNMSKGAVLLFSKSAALECGRLGNGIRVNTVHPGIIETPMMTDTLPEFMALSGQTNEKDAIAAMVELHPIGRLGQAIDVANGILYLASDESAFVTGSQLVIDGGMTA